MQIHRQAARQEYACQKCGKTISKGTVYLTYKHRYARRTIRCVACYPRASELTTSEKLSALYGAQETVGDVTAALQQASVQDMTAEAMRKVLGDLHSEVASAQETAQDVAGQYEESADNMEQYFPGSSRVDEIRDKASSCEDWAGELDNAASTIDGMIEEKTDFAAILVAISSVATTAVAALNERGLLPDHPIRAFPGDAEIDPGMVTVGGLNDLVTALRGLLSNITESSPDACGLVDREIGQASEIAAQMAEIAAVLDEAAKAADDAAESLSL